MIFSTQSLLPTVKIRSSNYERALNIYYTLPALKYFKRPQIGAIEKKLKTYSFYLVETITTLTTQKSDIFTFVHRQ